MRFWFKGVNNYIDQGNIQEVNYFLKECAKSCSDSYSLKIYQEAFNNEVLSIEESLELLKEKFSDFQYKLFQDRIEIVYKNCGCDLVQDNLINSPRICNCSELSLKYNWENIFGKNNVKIKRISSILEGDESCIFEVRLKISDSMEVLLS
ncbi:hypothetical protein [Halocella sp. SP3-1]|uniref:hypothetical protein n=1 Tax=Halocella sp. SP3-1 TaxID=2382161 RepID=UPI000F75481C|nr:hypothetical protein [Halocella sp. SP3-1]AZO94850.1 hypothetical protein D7D81_09720 [Halocella sp. SP3-1]MTI58535.1 hypothetical protein [Bacillota bacterium]